MVRDCNFVCGKACYMNLGFVHNCMQFGIQFGMCRHMKVINCQNSLLDQGSIFSVGLPVGLFVWVNST